MEIEPKNERRKIMSFFGGSRLMFCLMDKFQC
jgi:hypothetical protein